MKYFKVTATRPDKTVEWPFNIWVDVVQNNFDTVKAVGSTLWIDDYKNQGTALTLSGYHSFDDSNKLIVQNHVPLWKDADNAADVAEYIELNGIVFTIEEVTDVDVSGFDQISIIY